MDISNRLDPEITTAEPAEIATPEDIERLHAFPSSAEEETITVAVVDSGIDPEVSAEHPWFDDASIIETYDATGEGVGDQVGHGTAVASLIARLGGPVRLISVKIFGQTGRSTIGILEDAYRWLGANEEDIDVVNMSWGARRDVERLNRLHRPLVEGGGLVDVVAAGNTGSDGGSPATAPGAFSAGAVDEDGVPLRFSSFDPDQGNPDVAAVGGNVKLAATPGTGFGFPLDGPFVKESGTSFSAPVLSAAYCHLLRNTQKDWDGPIREAAPDIEGTPRDGAGLLRIGSLLGEVPPREPPEEEPPEEEPPEEEPPEDEPPEEPPFDQPPERDFDQTPAETVPDDPRFATYRARLHNIVDADTVDLVVDTGFRTTQLVRIEVDGVDAAEIYGVSHDSQEYEDGMAQMQEVEEFFEEAADEGEADWPLGVVVRSESTKACRWNGEVFKRGSDEETVSGRLKGAFPDLADEE